MSNLSDLPADPEKPGFIFVPELVTLEGLIEPVAIGSSAMLHRAPDQIRIALKRVVDPFLHMRGPFLVSPWESQVTKVGEGQFQYSPILDTRHHQFWIVSYWRKLFDRELEYALELADPGLTPLLSLLGTTRDSSGSIDSHGLLNWVDENWSAQKRVIGAAQVAGIERTWQQLIDFREDTDPSLEFIKKALIDFSDIKRVSAKMPLYIVGLFSIIEMLLTTQQDKTTENSLSHQLKEKLTLFGNRFNTPIALTNYFPNAGSLNFKSLVSKLYAYRSKVAHGSSVDFKGDLQVLESHKSVCAFLRDLLRKLLIRALEEPALFRDLKSC